MEVEDTFWTEKWKMPEHQVKKGEWDRKRWATGLKACKDVEVQRLPRSRSRIISEQTKMF